MSPFARYAGLRASRIPCAPADYGGILPMSPFVRYAGLRASRNPLCLRGCKFEF